MSQEHNPNAVILTRVSQKTSERIKFEDIIWAEPYTSRGGHKGIMILHSQGDFRFYLQEFSKLQEVACRYVGRLLKADPKQPLPELPWARQLPPINRQ